MDMAILSRLAPNRTRPSHSHFLYWGSEICAVSAWSLERKKDIDTARRVNLGPQVVATDLCEYGA